MLLKEENQMKKRFWNKTKIITTVLTVSLLVSVCANLMLASGSESHLQGTDEIYIMEAGILHNNLEFAQGQPLELVYDLTHDDYPEIIRLYGIDKTAGEGTELERAMRLMDEYSSRLTHESWYDNSVEMNALSLLEYSLDNSRHGINCRSKAQILNEMCLALGICSRKVWIMPNSPYDTDCHVVNEVWDSSLNKWVMLDITNNQYWVDEHGVPLSVLEIRHKGAMNEFCTPVRPGDRLDDLKRLKEKYTDVFLYIMKNMVYMEYLDKYTVGEQGTIWLLFPENLNTDYELIIDKSSVLSAPN